MDEEELAIGIDLGTTYSCVAALVDGRVQIIPNEMGENLTPSIVSFVNEGILVGEQTLNQLIKNPKKTIYSIKRLMGRNYEDEEVINDIKTGFWTFDVVEQNSSKRPVIRIEKDNNEYDYYYPEQISKFILEKLVQSARNYLNRPVTKAVITVPAYFNDAQRNATKLSATQAGLEVLRIINEPTAASLAYGLDKKLPKNENVMKTFVINNNEQFFDSLNSKQENSDEDEDEKNIIVFDLGGGTFDVTLLKIEDEEIFDVKATAGDSHLGGDDFNKKIIDYCLREFCLKFNYDKEEIKKDTKAMNRLKIAAEKAKIKLSSELETNIDIDEFYNNELLHTKLTRQNFEQICKDLFDKLLIPLDKVLDDTKMGISDINEIVLVGGSTRIPKIKDLINDYFYDININDSINPDETVAYGAAIQAAKLMKQGNDILNDVILMDITPFSLGTDVENLSNDPDIEKKGDLMSVIIPRGTKIPVKKTDNFETSEDYQESILIGVYEGEKKYVKDNHLLGEFELTDIPKKPQEDVEVEVTFSIDANGILTVSAVETSQGVNNSIKIINDKGFNEKEVIDNINNNNYTSLVNENNKEIINYKKEMNNYYKYYLESYSNKEKSKYIRNFNESLVNFLNTFDKEGNDTLGKKYFLYIKILFESYRVFIKLSKIINESDKNLILEHSKYFLKILSSFKNTNYNDYVQLLNFFLINLTEEDKKESIEVQKKIEELRIDILFDLVTYVMELLEEKAEKILSNQVNYAKYNSRYLFQNCIRLSELFIKSERDLLKNVQIRDRYNNCIEKCKNEIKNINANSLVEIDKLKESGQLFENNNNMEREELLILLDNYRQALQSIQGMNDYESEAIIFANIVKINYRYLNNQNYVRLKVMAEKSVSLSKSINKNVLQLQWYLEINNILQELREKVNDKIKNEQENFENNCKTKYKHIFDEISENRKKTNVEFIEFILEKHPPKKSPLKKNKTVKQNYEENPISFVERLSARYNPDNYPKNTEQEQLNYTIYHTISTELNAILSELNPNQIDLNE